MEEILKNLLPCPACNGHNLMWNGGYYFSSIVCKDCYYEVAPVNDDASVDEVASLWNKLRTIEEAISYCDEEVAKASKLVRKFTDLREHHKWLKIRIAERKRRENNLK